MPIVSVKAPDGKLLKVNAPEGASEEDILAFAKQEWEKPNSALEDLVQYGPGFLKQTGKTAVNAVGEMAAQIPRLMAIGPGSMETLMKSLGLPIPGIGQTADRASQVLEKGVEAAIPRPTNLTPAEQKWDIAARGMATGAITGPMAPGVAALAGGMGALGGDAGGRMAEKSGLPPILGEVAGALLAGGGTGFALGPKQTPAQQDVRRALDGTTPRDWAHAAQNVDDFNNVGSTTATVGEAFPQNSAVRDLTIAARGGNLSNTVKTRTQDRAADLQGMGQKFLDRIGPEVDANKISEGVVNAANATKRFSEEVRTKAFTQAIGDTQLKPTEVFTLYRQLIAEAKKLPNPTAREELASVAKQLLDEHNKNRPITDLATLSLRIKAMKETPAGATASTGRKIDSEGMRRAVDLVERRLEEVSPQFKTANDAYRLHSEGIVKVATSGALGRLQQNNPRIADDVTVGKLNDLFRSNPQELGDTLHQLARAIPTKNQPVSPSAAVRAWGQNALDKGPTNPGAAIRGNSGSAAEERIAAALTAAGKDPQQTMLPLKVADELQGMLNPAGMKELPRMGPLQLLLRPFRTADMMLTRQGLQGIEKEIADLLGAKPSAESLKRLQEIAMFDPRVRTMLSTLVPLSGLAGSQERN